jgi:phosphatidylglycerophosphate synthase
MTGRSRRNELDRSKIFGAAMDLPRPHLLILAESPDAFSILCGISLLERLLRLVQRIGFREATISSDSVESIRAQLTEHSWARAELSLKFQEHARGPATIGDISRCLRLMGPREPNRALVIAAAYYCDGRLLQTMADATTNTVLIDLNLPQNCAPLWEDLKPRACSWFCGTALLHQEWLSKQDPCAGLIDALLLNADTGRVALLDASQQSSYVPDLRKNLRPVCFPAPLPQRRCLAERLLQDAAQNGILDLPALVHAPIENWLVAHLWRTSIRPNQITFATMLVGLSVTLLYATGHLWFGTILALLVGILDGLDGKLARIKVETTELGKCEHALDYIVELSWWTALAHHFYVKGESPNAYLMLLLLVGSNLVDRLARRSVRQRLGRSLDDVAPFDRVVRGVGGRRNIYIWIFALGLALGTAGNAFVALCWWGIATAAVHLFRALQIGGAFSPRTVGPG